MYHECTMPLLKCTLHSQGFERPQTTRPNWRLRGLLVFLGASWVQCALSLQATSVATRRTATNGGQGVLPGRRAMAAACHGGWWFQIHSDSTGSSGKEDIGHSTGHVSTSMLVSRSVLWMFEPLQLGCTLDV